MGVLIGIALWMAWMVATEVFGGWAVVMLFGGVALLLLIGVLWSALERRADRKTVERLLALEPQRSWSEWALPAPESYALLRGVNSSNGDAFKLGLIQLIAMGVLEPEPFQAYKGGGGDTTLRPGQTPADGLSGSLVAIHRLWAASAAERVDEHQVVEDHGEEAKR